MADGCIPLLLSDPNLGARRDIPDTDDHKEAIEALIDAIAYRNDATAHDYLFGDEQAYGRGLMYMADRTMRPYWGELVRRAESGEIPVCYFVGVVMCQKDELDIGYESDIRRGFTYLQRAAEGGHMFAKYFVGLNILRLGTGTQMLYEAAYNSKRWINRAIYAAAVLDPNLTMFERRLMLVQSEDYPDSELRLEFIMENYENNWQTLVPWGSFWTPVTHALQHVTVKAAVKTWILVAHRLNLSRDLRMLIVRWICTQNGW